MENDRKNCEKNNMRLSLVLWTVLCGICMTVMLVFASNKTIVIADVSEDETGMTVDGVWPPHEEHDVLLTVQQAPGASDSFNVPLPKGIRPENVVVENRYVARELWIYIQNGDRSFYEKNVLSGDVSCIREGCLETGDDGIVLKLAMTDVMEYRSTLEGDVLTIACSRPHDLYDYTVVLDPAGGGSETGIDGYGLTEKELALEVARQVQKKFEMSNVRLYLTRTEDVDLAAEDRIALAEAVNADLYIRIGAQEDEDPVVYGIQGRYNAEYFIPGFGNADLADVVTKAVTIASSNRAVGLVPSDDDSVLHDIGTAAMELSMGYLSNPQEKALLEQQSYRERLADGILNAIREACDVLGQLEEEQERK